MRGVNKKQMLKKISFLFLVSTLLIFLFTQCYALKKYMRSDEEISEHYESMNLKPNYRSVAFNKRSVHYAVMAKNDTLPLLVFVHGAPGA
jgi:hypothetical protein